MLRTFLRFLSKTHQNPVPVDLNSGDDVVLYAYLKAPAAHSAGSIVSGSQKQRPERTNVHSSASTFHPSPANQHRERLLSMELIHTKLCSEKRCKKLQTLGIVTTGDLIAADLKTLSARFGAPKKSAPLLKRYRQAIRFALAVPAMMPRDALLLISIHRRSVRGLAMETPAMLYRDLQRFSESSQGQRLMRGRRLPSIKRLRRWIRTCETRLSAMNSAAANSAPPQAIRA
ncbi:hypothetical protein Q31b_23860 [Novipirellula aureliae]|uniref:DUF4332 domain-containing protein n=1 Tax=Novipirellula aureliae TaxID=2527966 RepID=A0A5C6E5W5_9BACT|nr:DUF4332 domain-containing protein [Novipirellula aureliae]TWU43347.1 hypothetical protein Q31b_23860 [Novipirellula aureliae]